MLNKNDKYRIEGRRFTNTKSSYEEEKTAHCTVKNKKIVTTYTRHLKGDFVSNLYLKL